MDIDAMIKAQQERLAAKPEETAPAPSEPEKLEPKLTTYRFDVVIRCPYADCGEESRIANPHIVSKVMVGAIQGGSFNGKCPKCERPIQSACEQRLDIKGIPNRHTRRAAQAGQKPSLSVVK